MPDPQMKLPPGATLVSDGPAMKLPPGATLVTNSTLPQPTAEPDDGAIFHAVKAAGGDLANAAKGLYHTITDAPETAADKTAFALGGGTVGLTLKRMVHGYFNAVQDSIDKAKKAAAEGDMSGVMLHSAAAGLPLTGPMTEGVYDQAKSGDTAGAVGVGGSRVAQLMSMAPENSVIPNPATGIVKAGAAVANKALDAAEPIAPKIYQSALKPSTAANSPAEIRTMVRAGLDNSIPISEVGSQKLAGLIDNLNQQVQAKIASGAKSGATVDPRAVAARADQARARFTNQVNPTADLNAIDASKQEFLANNPNPIPVDAAQTMKQGTYQQLKARAYGELGSATVEAQKSLARGIKEELETQFPEIKGLNADQGKAIGLDQALDKAVQRINNRDIFGLGPKIASTGAGVAAGIMTGSAGAGAGVAAISGLLQKVVGDPAVQSRIAIAIDRATKGRPLSALTGRARVVGYLNALGNSAQADNGQSTQQQQ